MYVSTWPGLESLLPFAKVRASMPHPFDRPRKTFGYLARGLIHHLFAAMRLGPSEVVLVPDYHHGNEVAAIRAAGATVRFYPVRRDLEPDLEALERSLRQGARVLYVIHHVGWPQPMPALTALAARHGALLIEDCALALFSELDGRPLGSFGDHAVYCLYKTLPVPNGGLLVQNGAGYAALDALPLRAPGAVSVYGRSLDLLLESVQSNAERLGRGLAALKGAVGSGLSLLSVERAVVGDAGFDLERAALAMSPLSARILERLDLERVAPRRRANYLALERALGGRATPLVRSLPPGVCPLFFPVLVEDKRAAVAALRARGVGAVEFWNHGDPAVDPARAGDALFLRRHVIELPIHQDLCDEHMEYVAREVLALGLRLPKPRPAPRGPRVEVLRGGRALLAPLAEEWRALSDEGPADDLFHRPEWLMAYLEAFEPDAELLVLVARSEGRLRALLPLVEERARFSRLPARRLRAPVNDHSGRFDLIHGVGELEAVERALWDQLRALDGWDVLEARDVPAGGAFERLRARAEADEWPTGRRRSMDTPYLPLDGDPFARLDAKFRSNLRRRAKKLEALGPVGLRRVEHADRALLDALYRTEKAGWKGDSGSAIDSQASTRRFYDRIATAAERLGRLALYALECDGRPVAFHFGLVSKERYFLLKPTYDEALAYCSPGQLLMERVVRDCAARGLRELDFLGPWMPWKADWGPSLRPHAYSFVMRASLWGSVLHVAKLHAAPLARRAAARARGAGEGAAAEGA